MNVLRNEFWNAKATAADLDLNQCQAKLDVFKEKNLLEAKVWIASLLEKYPLNHAYLGELEMKPDVEKLLSKEPLLLPRILGNRYYVFFGEKFSNGWYGITCRLDEENNKVTYPCRHGLFGRNGMYSGLDLEIENEQKFFFEGVWVFEDHRED